MLFVDFASGDWNAAEERPDRSGARTGRTAAR